MRSLVYCLIIGLLVEVDTPAAAIEFKSFSAEVRKSLLAGDVAILPQRPDETDDVDRRFVTAAMLIEGTRDLIWKVINDKEGAEKFVDGVLESTVVEAKEKELVVEQRTKVGGPKDSYRYTLRHVLTPKQRADFSYVEGELRNVLGSWWIFEGPDSERFLVVYSLHIDPGIFAPQFVVKSGMKKSMPGTLQSMDREVARRTAMVSEPED